MKSWLDALSYLHRAHKIVQILIGMALKILLLFLLTLLANLQIGDAINCYKCQSTSKENYLGEKDDEIPRCGSSLGSTVIVDCPGDTICQYFEISDNNTRTTVRTCAPLDGCDEFPIEDTEKILSCYTCDDDLCNKKSREPDCSPLKFDINLNVNLNVRNINDNNNITLL